MLDCVVDAAAAVVPAAGLIAFAIRDGDGMLVQATSLARLRDLRVAAPIVEQPLRVDDLCEAGGQAASLGRTLAMRSLLLIPMPWPQRQEGVLLFAAAGVAAFDDNDLLLAQLLGGIVATACRPARLRGRAISDRETGERTSLALAAGSVIGIGAWEPGGLSLDDRLLDAFGFKASEIAGLTQADFLYRVHPDDRPALLALGGRTRIAGAALDASFRLCASPQDEAPAWRWVEARGVVAVGQDGGPGRLTGVLIDIDARKRVELELAQNEQTVRQIADSLPVLLVYIAPDMTFRFANRAYRSTVPGAAEIVAGDPVRMLFAEAVEGGPGGLLRRCLAGERTRFDSQSRDRHGVLRDLDMEYIPRLGGNGGFDGCYVIGIDITRRKEEERALNRSNLTLEQSLAVVQQESERIWRLSRDLLCVRDRDWRLRSVNPAWSAMLGWEPETLLGEDSLDLIHPEDRPRTLQARTALRGDANKGGFENRYRNSDGSYRWLSWSVVTADGLVYGTARDVTVEREAAQRVQRIEEQLRQSQKMEAVGQLTGGIAHDFNNLLTGVIGSLEMMRNRMQQGRLDGLGKYMDAAAGAAERAAAVTHRLLSFSRRQALEPKLTSVDRLVDAMDELIRRAAGAVATLQVVRHRGAWSTLCDPRQLEIALLNLINNARDAMPQGGRLVIETANAVLEDFELDGVVPAGEYVALSVTDTGTGMSADVAARAFDPFFTTKPIGRGTGLGLSMVYGFARQSGGHARIASVPGRGARVTIYLPRAAQSSLPAPQARAVGSGRAVLLVEDEPMVRMLVGEVLGELDCDTIEAVDGAGGMRVLQGDRQIDLLITDIGLPGGINGVQMAEAALRQRPDLKVLFITGLAESAVHEAGERRLGMEVIGKPFTIELLMERVRAMMPP